MSGRSSHDPEEHHDWAITAEIDLAASDRQGEAVVAVTDVGNTSKLHDSRTVMVKSTGTEMIVVTKAASRARTTPCS